MPERQYDYGCRYEEACMKSLSLICAALTLTFGSAAAPAFAQDDRYDRSRAGQVADDIARGIEATADAVGTVTESVYNSVNGVRWRARERFAVNRCLARVERYGRARVDHVEPHERRSWRVYGTVGGRSSYGGYPSRSDAARSFRCTVRDDGRVKLKTSRIRR
jgi:hypothetical protein